MCKVKTNAKTPWYSGNNRPIVLLDMDDVITNTLRSAVKNFNDEHGTNFNYKDCTSWDLTEFLGVDRDEVMKLFRDEGFFETGLPSKLGSTIGNSTVVSTPGLVTSGIAVNPSVTQSGINNYL